MGNKLVVNQNVEIKVLKEEDLEDILSFQQEIINEMEHKEWFVPLTEEEFLTPIRNKDNVYFLIHDKEIIGLLVLTCDIPEVLEEYKLPSDNYMLIDSVMVKKKYRGQKLQKQMLKFAFKRALEQKVEGLVATIHPDNVYSLNNFIDEDYICINTLTIHGGSRKIMVKYTNKD